MTDPISSVSKSIVKLKISNFTDIVDNSSSSTDVPVTFINPELLNVYGPMSTEDISKADDLLKNRWSKGTSEVYARSWNLFIQFLQFKYPIISRSEIQEGHILSYITHMQGRELKYSTIQCRLYAILHHMQDMNIDMRKITPHIEGLKRTIGTQQKHKNPILITHLHRMINTIPPEGTARQLQDRALLLVMWHTGMRREESANLQWEDIKIVPGGINILIKRSKGDQEGKGQYTNIVPGDVGYCPVLNLLDWQSKCGGTGYIWRTINGENNITDRPISPTAIYNRVKKFTVAIGMDKSEFSPHSMRAGLITEGFNNNTPIHIIQAQSRHSNIATLNSYAQVSDKIRQNIGNYIRGKK